MGEFSSAFDAAYANVIKPPKADIRAIGALLDEVVSERVSLFRHVPRTKWAAIKAGVSTDDHIAYLQEAIDAGKPYSEYGGGAREIYIPAGKWNFIAAGADLSDCHSLNITGAGAGATEINFGDFAAFDLTGDVGTALKSIAIRRMLLHGPGKASTSAHGIKATFTNGCVFDEIKAFACRHAFDFEHVWQNFLRTIYVTGEGDLQNYHGLYGHPTTEADPDCALVIQAMHVEHCDSDGVRLNNLQGSKIVSLESSGNGGRGLSIGDPVSGTFEAQWGHINVLVCDSNASQGMLLKAGASSGVKKLQIDTLWVGNNGDYGAWLEGCDGVSISNVQGQGNTKGSVNLYNCTQCVLNGGVLQANNESADATAHDVLLNGSTYCTVANIVSDMDNAAAKSICEFGAADSNNIHDNTVFQGMTVVGASSRVHHNPGYVTESHGTWTFPSGATSHTFNHLVDRTPTYGEIMILPRLVPSEVGVDGFKITAITSTQVTIAAIGGAVSGDIYLDFQINVTRA